MEATPAYPGRRSAWWLVAILFFASIVSVIDRGILNFVVDPVRRDLSLTDIHLGLLQGLAFGLFYAFVGLPVGLTADRYSRRNLIIGGIAVWSLATVAGGLAQGFGSLFASRLLVGLGEAALAPAAISLIGDLFPPHQRGRPISVYLIGQAVAGGLSISFTSLILASAAAGRFAAFPLLANLAAWRIAFVCSGLLGLVVVLALLTTREPPRHTKAQTVNIGRQAVESLAYLVRNAAVFVPLYLGFALCFLAAYGAGSWAPTMLTRGFGATTAQIGKWLGPITMLFAVTGPLIGGFLVDYFARRGRPLAKFVILAATPLCIIPSALAVFAPGLMAAVVLVASSSAFVAIIGTTTLASIQSMVPANMRGFSVSLTGLVNTLIGATSGPLLIAMATERIFHSPALVGRSIALVVIPALVLGAAFYALAGLAMRRQLARGGETAALVTGPITGEVG